MHANETFTLAWEGQAPNTYWSSTKSYVQSFLSDVAADSGSLDNPYADTTQYWDGSAFRTVRPTAQFSVEAATTTVPPSASSAASEVLGRVTHCPAPATVLSTETTSWAGPLVGGRRNDSEQPVPDRLRRPARSHEPRRQRRPDQVRQARAHAVVTVLTPPGVVVCLDSTGTLCSVNGPHRAAADGARHRQLLLWDHYRWYLPRGGYLPDLGRGVPAERPSTVTTTGSTRRSRSRLPRRRPARRLVRVHHPRAALPIRAREGSRRLARMTPCNRSATGGARHPPGPHPSARITPR